MNKFEECFIVCELISSSPNVLAEGIVRLYKRNSFKIFGGCCGTDEKYLDEIAKMIVSQ